MLVCADSSLQFCESLLYLNINKYFSKSISILIAEFYKNDDSIKVASQFIVGSTGSSICRKTDNAPSEAPEGKTIKYKYNAGTQIYQPRFITVRAHNTTPEAVQFVLFANVPSVSAVVFILEHIVPCQITTTILIISMQSSKRNKFMMNHMIYRTDKLN